MKLAKFFIITTQSYFNSELVFKQKPEGPPKKKAVGGLQSVIPNEFRVKPYFHLILCCKYL